MASWRPGVTDLATATPGRTITESAETAAWIGEAVAEVVAEVGHFDVAKAVNADADPAEQVTLGDLARTAATLRAAYFAERRAPDQGTYGPDGYATGLAAELHARYRDALARLRSWVDRLDAGGTATVSGSGRLGSITLEGAWPAPWAGDVWYAPVEGGGDPIPWTDPLP